MSSKKIVKRLEDFNDPCLTIDQWIEQFKVFKEVYGGHAFVRPDAGQMNVCFEQWVDPEALSKAMDAQLKHEKYLATLPLDIRDIVTGVKKL